MTRHWLPMSTACFLAGTTSILGNPAFDGDSSLRRLVASSLLFNPQSTQPSTRDAETARRLLGQTRSDDDPLNEVLALMDDAGRRLSQDYDSGENTQDVQDRVLETLDDVIEQARKNLKEQPSSGRQRGEKRQSGERGQPRRSARAGQRSAEPSQSAPRPTGEGPAATRPASADQPELRRAWGFLPDRDRDAIVQGWQEEYLSKYREQIERYYRAIAEQAERQK